MDQAIKMGDIVIRTGTGFRGKVIRESGVDEDLLLVEWTHRSTREGPKALEAPFEVWEFRRHLLKVQNLNRTMDE